MSGSIGWKAGEKVSWLDISPTSGETPGSIAVTVDTTGLEPGTYVGRVTVTATTPGVLFPVRRLKVVLEVTAPTG